MAGPGRVGRLRQKTFQTDRERLLRSLNSAAHSRNPRVRVCVQHARPPKGTPARCAGDLRKLAAKTLARDTTPHRRDNNKKQKTTDRLHEAHNKLTI